MAKLATTAGDIFGCILLVLLLIKALEATTCTPLEGKPKTPVKPCEIGWTETPSPSICTKLFNLSVIFSRAVDMCQGSGSELIEPYALEMKSNIAALPYTKNKTRFWLAISDEQKEGYWVWRNKYVTEYTNWAKNEGRLKRTENCAMSGERGFWFDTPCKATHYVVCQTESLMAPKGVNITIHYHLSPNIVFKNGTFNITCTALNAEVNELEWVVHNMEKKIWTFTETTLVEEIETEDGCMNKTTSVYTVEVTPSISDLILSCFGYKLKKSKKCAQPNATYSFCDRSKPILVVTDGPFETPTLAINNKEHPGPLSVNSLVNISCYFRGGDASTLLWVVYFRWGPTVFNSTDERVTTTFTKLENGERLVYSELKFAFPASLSGISIACFAYDFRQYGLSAECEATDSYCVMTSKLSVKIPPITIKRNDMITLNKLLFAAWVSTVIICVLIYTCWKSLAKSEEHGEEDVTQQDKKTTEGVTQQDKKSTEGVSEALSMNQEQVLKNFSGIKEESVMTLHPVHSSSSVKYEQSEETKSDPQISESAMYVA